MQVNLPEKRVKKEKQENFVLNRMYFDKALKQQICVFNAIGYRKPYYVPFNFLTEENKQVIDSNKQTQETPNAKAGPAPQKNEKNSKEEKKSLSEEKKRTRKRAAPREEAEKVVKQVKEVKENKKSILGMLKDVYQRGNYLLDRPVKIIGCHWKDSLSYSVLFRCKHNLRNVSRVPHEAMIEKFPELLVEYLARSPIKHLDS